MVNDKIDFSECTCDLCLEIKQKYLELKQKRKNALLKMAKERKDRQKLFTAKNLGGGN